MIRHGGIVYQKSCALAGLGGAPVAHRTQRKQRDDRGHERAVDPGEHPFRRGVGHQSSLNHSHAEDHGEDHDHDRQ